MCPTLKRTSFARLSLGAERKVRTLVGGDLFDFGDKDGSATTCGCSIRWGWRVGTDKLLIADTYNHRIKLLDPASREVQSFAGSGKPGQDDGDSLLFMNRAGWP